MNEYRTALDDLMGDDWETTAYEQGIVDAAEDTARQAARFDQHFGDDSARSIRAARHYARADAAACAALPI